VAYQTFGRRNEILQLIDLKGLVGHFGYFNQTFESVPLMLCADALCKIQLHGREYCSLNCISGIALLHILLLDVLIFKRLWFTHAVFVARIHTRLDRNIIYFMYNFFKQLVRLADNCTFESYKLKNG
jgi:hypothetical protein